MKSCIPLNGVSYKYCVYTPKTVHGSKDAQYEYVYNIHVSGGVANRYLSTNQRSKFSDDT